MKWMILNGPSINLTGLREPEVYGAVTYEKMTEYLREAARALGHEAQVRQTNHEGVLIDWIQEAYFEGYDGIIINPGAYTHTSYALYDALRSVPVPAVEVHLSDIHSREPFRRVSLTAPACIGQISGKGQEGYRLAMEMLLKHGQ